MLEATSVMLMPCTRERNVGVQAPAAKTFDPMNIPPRSSQRYAREPARKRAVAAKDSGACFWVPCSAAPRAGSLTVSQKSSARPTPGSPAAMNIARQP
jgi:hypothetical protein